MCLEYRLLINTNCSKNNQKIWSYLQSKSLVSLKWEPPPHSPVIWCMCLAEELPSVRLWLNTLTPNPTQVEWYSRLIAGPPMSCRRAALCTLHGRECPTPPYMGASVQYKEPLHPGSKAGLERGCPLTAHTTPGLCGSCAKPVIPRGPASGWGVHR